MNQQSESTDSAGGYLLTPALSSRFVDLARANSVCLKTGTPTLNMEARDVRIAKLTADATSVWRAEAAAVQSSEVTQSQWESVMGTTPWTVQIPAKEGADYPTTYVHWDDAMEFCRRLSRRPEQKAAGHEYRLPTEAEWEYACRAGTTTTYHFGDDVSKLGEYAWYRGNSDSVGGRFAHRVRQKKPNPWGLHDMHGNVWEWCQDRPAAYGTQRTITDPSGPGTVRRRVLRGGSFDSNASYLSSGDHFTYQPVYRYNISGFRVATIHR